VKESTRAKAAYVPPERSSSAVDNFAELFVLPFMNSATYSSPQHLRERENVDGAYGRDIRYDVDAETRVLGHRRHVCAARRQRVCHGLGARRRGGRGEWFPPGAGYSAKDATTECLERQRGVALWKCAPGLPSRIRSIGRRALGRGQGYDDIKGREGFIYLVSERRCRVEVERAGQRIRLRRDRRFTLERAFATQVTPAVRS